MKTLILSLAILLSTSAFATGQIKKDFSKSYPDFNKVLSCKTCHTTAPQLNPYGIDLQKVSSDFKAIELIDSDGDTFSNLAEIQALTQPGNKD